MKSEGRLISIKELVALLVEKIWWIIGSGVITSILVASFIYVQNRNIPENEGNQTYILSDNEMEIVQLCWEYEDDYNAILEYIDNSEYMQLDAFNLNQVVITWIIDSENEKDISRYTKVLSDYILNKSYGKSDNKYMFTNELLQSNSLVSTNSEDKNGVLTVVVRGKDEDSASKLSELIRTDVLEYADGVLQENGIKVTEVSCEETIGVNYELLKKQQEILSMYNSLRGNINNLCELMNEKQKEAFNKHSQEVEILNEEPINIKFDKKNIFVGAFLGCIITVVIIFLYYIWSSKIFVYKEIEHFGLRNFGTVHVDNNKSFRYKIARRIRIGKNALNEIPIREKLNKVTYDKFVIIGKRAETVNHLLGVKDCKYTKTVIDAMNDNLLLKETKVVLCIELRKDNWNKLSKDIQDCKDLQLEIIGIILVD